MKNKILSLIISMLLCFGTVPHAMASDEVMLIVELDGGTGFFPDSEAFAPMSVSEETEREEIIAEIKENINSEIEIPETYDVLLNGFSLSAEYSDIDKIKEIPGVKSVYVAQTFYTPQLKYSKEQISITPQISDTLGYTGKSRLIAVIDNEFESSHDFFKISPENPKLSREDVVSIVNGGKLYSKINSEEVYKSEKIPFAYDYGNGDYTTEGSLKTHGTHVAGIAAGNGGVAIDNSVMSGVAPDAQLALMKVADDSGSMRENVIIKAIEDAIVLGADSINLSLGSDYSPYYTNSAFSKVIQKARDLGVFTAVSNGNAARGYKSKTPFAENIDYSAGGTPAAYADSVAVASANSIGNYGRTPQLELPSKIKINALTQNGFESKLGKNLYYEYQIYDPSDAETDFERKLAVVKRGRNINVYTLFDSLKSAGALGVILWNSEEEYVLLPNDLALPAAVVTNSGGALLENAEDKRVQLISGFTEIEGGTKEKLSYFSSWGFTENFDLKPEISAPGSLIYSSVSGGDYTLMQGTSMASPHIAGAAALLNQYIEENEYLKETDMNRASLIENIMMSTAEVQKSSENLPYSPRWQGAGVIDISKALAASVILKASGGKSKLNLGNNLSDVIPIDFSVKNISDKNVEIDSVSFDVFTDDYEEKNGKIYVAGSKRLTGSGEVDEIITLSAGGEKDVSFKINLSEKELSENKEIFRNGFYIDGYIYLNCSDGNCYNMPFCGFYGDFTKVPYFDETMYSAGGSLLFDDTKKTGETYLTSGNNVLGRNIFTKEYSGSNIAVSASGYNELKLQLQPMRSGYLRCFVRDENGKIIINYTDILSVTKFKSSLLTFLSSSRIKSLQDGRYTLVLCADNESNNLSLDTKDHDDVLELDFTVDNEAPSIKSAYYSEDGTRLIVESEDNNAIQGIAVENSNAAAAGSSYFKGYIDVTDIDLSNAKIKVYDYAGNTTETDVPQYPHILRYALTEKTESGGGVYLTYNIFAKDAVSAAITAAAYDNSGRLISVSSPEKTEFNIGKSEKSIFIPGSAGAEKVKLFLWENMENMIPLSQ